MKTYLLKRLLLTIPMLIGITFINFMIMQLAPGKPGGGAGGGEMSTQRLTAQQWEAMNKAFHLDEPMYKRYLYWLGVLQPKITDEDRAADELYRRTDKAQGSPITKKGLIWGDFGYSMETTSIPVWQRIREALPITILFNVISLLMIYTIAIPIGVYSATHQYSWGDRVSTVGLFVLYSMPTFWVAVLLIKLMVSLPEGWSLPFQNVKPDNAQELTTLQFLYECARHMVLPLAVMTYAGMARLSRYMRSSMLDVVRADYIRTARAKGLGEFFVIYKHAMRNSLIPIVTLLGGLLPAMIGGSIIVEYIFGIPGMGNMGFKALQARDYTLLMGQNFMIAVLVMAGFLLSDILYVLVDPRISFEGK